MKPMPHIRICAASGIILAAVMSLAAQSSRSTAISYPRPHTISQTDDFFGTKVNDPYRWMEDLDAPETKAWVEAENAITAEYFKPLTFRTGLHARMLALSNYERFGLPQQHGGRYFYAHNTGLQNQSVQYWTDGLHGEPHVLIDPNTLAADGTVALGSMSVTHDGTLAALSLAEAGSDWQKIVVRDVAMGKDLPDVIRWVKFGGAAWLRDNSGFFYTGYDAPTGNELKQVTNGNRIFFHKLGTAQKDDLLIFERADNKELYLSAGLTDDGNFLLISQSQGTSPQNELAFLDLTKADLRKGGAKIVIQRVIDTADASYRPIGNVGSKFWLHTTLDAPNGKVIAIDLAHPERKAWTTVIPQRKSALDSVALVHRTLIAQYLTDAHTSVELFAEDGKPLHALALPGIGTADGFGGERDDTETFYSFTNFTSPGMIYRLDMQTMKSEVYRDPKVAFDRTAYETKEVFVPSKDGTQVPMFLTYKKGLKLDGANPTLLYAYGGFNISLTPSFSPSRIAWLEHGGIYAQASLRGGGEYGEAWHQAGMKLKKQNVFDDFIACAEWLVANKYTSTAKLGIRGESNGGLLMGAMLTQRPDLFGAVAAGVGVMDMLRFDKFTVGWGWKADYGSPSENAAEFQAIYAYSPLHRLKAGTKYPATLIFTADHDDRVFPAHSFKFAATMQGDQAGPAPVLIRIETRAGHGGGMPLSKRLDVEADIMAFLLKELHSLPPTQ